MRRYESLILGQAGELLAGIELLKRRFRVRVFGGTFPGIDLLAEDEEKRQFSVEVKSKKRQGEFQFDALKFFEVLRDKKTKTQTVGRNIHGNPEKIYIFISVGDVEEFKDLRFYLLSYRVLQRWLRRKYQRNLERKNYRRTKKWDSTHETLSERELDKFRDNWKIFKRRRRR
jgi:hypothetical protein